MPDREVTIKISAKNLTETQFRKVKQGLGGLGSSASGATKKTSGLQRAFSSFGKAAPGALKAVAIGAAAVSAAVVGIATAVVKLGERGAVVGDVKEAFDKLSAASGETGAVMLGALSQGVKGTVSNFELMKVANKALGAGLLNSADDARTMAEGARLLAKRTGGDTTQAFETMVTAIASGRTAQLKQLGLFVDNKQAVEDYAKAQGKSVTSMNDADRAAALQAATLAALRKELESNAPPLADFGELIGQGKVAVTNLVDGLALMISKSPPLLAGLQAVRDMIGNAFGGDSSGLILTITNIIEKAALIVIEFGKAGISAAGFLYRGFQGIKLVVMGLAIAITEINKRTIGFLATTLEAAASIPVVGVAFKLQAEGARMAADALEGVNTGLKAQIVDTTIAAAGLDTFGQGLTTATGVLDAVKTSMVNAGLSQREFNAGIDEGAIALGGLATSGEESGARIKLSLSEWGAKLLENLDVTRDKTKQWAEETEAHFTRVSGEEVAGKFTGAMLTVGGIVHAQTMAMGASFAAFGLQTKTELNALVEQAEKDFKTIQESGEATDEALAVSAQKLADLRVKLAGEQVTGASDTKNAITDITMAMAQSAGQGYKAMAVSGVRVAIQLAIAKSLASLPWPFSLVAAAGAAAAGAIVLHKLQGTPAYRMGTQKLDYQEFGSSSPAMLHGKEAVIPQGGGHQLAEEISGALARKRGAPQGADIIVERFERIGAKLDTLPRAIQRAVRDGMLLASG